MKSDDLWIYIPTLGRVDKQVTIRNIPSDWLPKTRLVVMPEEYEELKSKYGDCVIVCPNRGLSPTRQWIIDTCPSRYVIMIDDDVTFYKRHEGIRLRRATTEETSELFYLMLTYLKSGIAAVGISPRHTNRYVYPDDYKDIGKMYGVYAIDTEIIRKHGITFRLPLMEDYDITLCLLEAGYKNRIIYNYAWNQPASGAEGGCSLFRNQKLQKECAEQLAKLHPESVNVVIKKTAYSWKGLGQVRHDVNFKWAKAYRPHRVKTMSLKDLTGGKTKAQIFAETVQREEAKKGRPLTQGETRKLEMALLKPEKLPPPPVKLERKDISPIQKHTVLIILKNDEDYELFSRYFKILSYKTPNVTDLKLLMALLRALEDGTIVYDDKGEGRIKCHE